MDTEGTEAQKGGTEVEAFTVKDGYPLFDDYPDLSGVDKALVVILKNIGDVLLSSPVFYALKKALPDAEIDAYVNMGTEEMLLHNPAVNDLIVLNRPAIKGGFSFKRAAEELRLFKRIRSAGYDMVLLLSTGSRSVNAALLSGASIRVGPELKKAEFLGKYDSLTHVAPMASSGRHYVERYLDTLRRIGIFPEKDEITTRLFEGINARANVEEKLGERGIGINDKYVVVHPTSRWMFKCWTTAKVALLIDRLREELSVKVVLTSGPDSNELEYIEKITGAVTGDVVDLSGCLTLCELGAVIADGTLFFGVDSAPMHMAAAAGTPVVALFGPTSEVDWAPWGDGHTVITLERFECRPCNRDGCDGSKISDCITEIEVDTVFDRIKERL